MMKSTTLLTLKIMVGITFTLVIGLMTACSSIQQTYVTVQLPTQMINTSTINPTATNTVPAPSLDILIETPIPSVTVIPTIFTTATNTPLPTAALPSMTPEPTLTTDERNAYLLELIETSGGCDLPCLWGITPGETKWEDAERKLGQLGGHIFEARYSDYTYYSREFQNWQDRFGVIFSDIVINGAVDVSSIQVVIFNDSPIYQSLWEQYSLKSIFTTYGMPSEAWVILTVGEVDPASTLYELWLFYEEKEFLINFYGIATKEQDNYLVCPNLMDNTSTWPINRIFTVQSQNNERPLENAYMMGGGIIPQSFPIEEATGLSIQEFYDIVLTGDSTACFSTPRDIWP